MNYPFVMYVVLVLYCVLGGHLFRVRHNGYGIPGLAVLTTVLFWYCGDAYYNNYDDLQQEFARYTIENAWWQVVFFMVAFGALLPWVNQCMNGSRVRPSRVMKFVETRIIDSLEQQGWLDRLFSFVVFLWFCLMAIALIRAKGDVIGLFLPWLGRHAEPWARSRIGGRIDFIISFCAFVHIFLTSSIGVVAALSNNKKTRNLAIAVLLMALPYFLFGRTRNSMLAVLIPGFLAFVFVRMKSPYAIRAVFVICVFLVLQFWFLFVIEVRSRGSVAQAFAKGEVMSTDEDQQESQHRGLNMLSELCYINQYIENGKYEPNWGARYFAELVNPIPRSIWPSKPTVGMDYAIARGFAGGSVEGGGVTASISTGLIGQGVVNFGRIGGPFAAAVLSAIWASFLARQDYLTTWPGRLLLYAVGLILTFNMGRDFTFLVLYPFLFGVIIVGWIEKRLPNLNTRTSAN